MSGEKEEEPLGSRESDAVAKALKHIHPEVAELIHRSLFLDQSIVALKLADLSPSNVSYRYAFQLSDYHRISGSPRRMPHEDNQVVKEEIEGMLKD